MCKAKSFICIKGEDTPRWSPNHDSHGKLIKELGLKDKELHLRNFVKIEYFPKNDNWFSPSDEWEFFIDEQETLPAWFEEDKKLWEDRCWNVIKKKFFPLIKCGIFPGDLSVNSQIKNG